MSVFRTCILLYNSIYLRPQHTLNILPLIRSGNHGDLDLCCALCYSISLLVSSSTPLYRYLFMHSIFCFIHEDDLPMEIEVRVRRGFIRPSSIQKGLTAFLSLLIRSTHQNKTNPGGAIGGAPPWREPQHASTSLVHAKPRGFLAVDPHSVVPHMPFVIRYQSRLDPEWRTAECEQWSVMCIAVKELVSSNRSIYSFPLLAAALVFNCC